MNNNILKAVTAALATATLVALGAGPASAAKPYSPGADVPHGSGSIYQSNYIETPSGNYIAVFNEHSGYGNPSSSSAKSSSRGHELISKDGKEVRRFVYSYPDGSGGQIVYSSHLSNGKVQEKIRTKGGY